MKALSNHNSSQAKLNKILTIKKSADFQKVSKNGLKFHSHSLTLLTYNSSLSKDKTFQNQTKLVENFCRVGYTVSKSVSKSAVKRNLAKRRIRETARKLLPTLGKSGFDYVIIARREILNFEFVKIQGDFEFCLRKIHQALQKASPSSQNPHQDHFK